MKSSFCLFAVCILHILNHYSDKSLCLLPVFFYYVSEPRDLIFRPLSTSLFPGWPLGLSLALHSCLSNGGKIIHALLTYFMDLLDGANEKMNMWIALWFKKNSYLHHLKGELIFRSKWSDKCEGTYIKYNGIMKQAGAKHWNINVKEVRKSFCKSQNWFEVLQDW